MIRSRFMGHCPFSDRHAVGVAEDGRIAGVHIYSIKEYRLKTLFFSRYGFCFKDSIRGLFTAGEQAQGPVIQPVGQSSPGKHKQFGVFAH